MVVGTYHTTTTYHHVHRQPMVLMTQRVTMERHRCQPIVQVDNMICQVGPDLYHDHFNNYWKRTMIATFVLVPATRRVHSFGLTRFNRVHFFHGRWVVKGVKNTIETIIPYCHFFIPVFGGPFGVCKGPGLTFTRTRVRFYVRGLVNGTRHKRFHRFRVTFNLAMTMGVTRVGTTRVIHTKYFVTFVQVLKQCRYQLGVFYTLLYFGREIGHGKVFPTLLARPDFVGHYFGHRNIIFTFGRHGHCPHEDVTLHIFRGEHDWDMCRLTSEVPRFCYFVIGLGKGGTIYLVGQYRVTQQFVAFRGGVFFGSNETRGVLGVHTFVGVFVVGN